jgi:lysophospholipase L1-like esterase
VAASVSSPQRALRADTVYCAPKRASIALQQPSIDPDPLPVEIPPTNGQVRYIGRFTDGKDGGPCCSWSASTVELRFAGTAINARLDEKGTSDLYEVVVDGKDMGPLALKNGPHLYRLYTATLPGAHTVQLVKRTEPFCGITRFEGFQLSGNGRLLTLPARPHRRIEVVGDSISCGYGNEGKNEHEHFTPATENAYQTYGAIASREVGAEYVCLAWSGRKMWPDDTMPEIYDRTLPTETSSTWDFSHWKPDVVVITLGTNDFGRVAPDRKGWIAGYQAFVSRVRANYPHAAIYCATSPMMGGKEYSTHKEYLEQIVQDEHRSGDKNVRMLLFTTQDAANGLGSDWHPSVKTHEIMAATLVSALHNDLGWSAEK